MGDSRYQAVCIFGQGIDHVTLFKVQLLCVWECLAKDRLVTTVAAIDQGKIGRDRHGELLHGQLDLSPLQRFEFDIEQFFTGLGIGDRIFKLPMPVYPWGKIYFFITAMVGIFLADWWKKC